MERAHRIFGLLNCPRRACIVACVVGEGRDQTNYRINNCLTIIGKATVEDLGCYESVNQAI